MKIDIDKQLLKYSLYVIITTIAIYISYLLLSNIGLIINKFLHILGSILSLLKPFIIACIISYLLFPVVKFIENILSKNKIIPIKNESTKRTSAIIFSYLSIIGILTSFLWGIYFMIGGQISKNTTIPNMTSQISEYLSSSVFDINSVKETIKSLNIPLIEKIEPYMLSSVQYIQNYVSDNVGNFTLYIMSIGSSIATFFISLIMSIYILKDSNYFIDLWKKLYKLVFRNSKLGIDISDAFKIIHETFSNFIRGQLLEAFFVGL